MEQVMKVLDCDDRKALPTLCLHAWHSLEDIGRGSLSQDTKANYLLGGWPNKANHKIEIKKEEASEIITERDIIVASNATQLIGNKGNNKEKVTKQRNRTLSICKKSYKKWFMTADK